MKKNLLFEFSPMAKYMKFLCFMFILLVGFSYGAYSQNITLNMKNKSLDQVLRAIESQTSYKVLFNVKQVSAYKNVTVDVKNVKLEEALEKCLEGTGLKYILQGRTIVITLADKKVSGIEIKGVVRDKSGMMLPGATIMIKNTTTGVTSDVNGAFSILVPKTGIILKVTFVGYKPKEFLAEEGKEIIIVMEEEVNELNEVVAIGYGTAQKKDLTGSVYHIDEQLLSESAATDIGQIIQGQVPGMYVLTGSDAPGAEVQIQIRGISSIKGNVNPLIVLDGVPMPDNFNIGQLNPRDVKSLDVLTDASAAAIYGSRASAGVIIIASKRGEMIGKPRVSYSYNRGFSQLTSSINTLSPEEFKLLLFEAVRNTAMENNYDHIESYPGYMAIMAPGFFGEANTEWMKLLMRTPSKQTHNFSISGGVPDARYYLSFGYNENIGMLPNTKDEKYNLSLSLDMRPYKFLRTAVSLKGDFGDNDINNQSLMTAASARPDLPAYNEDGSYYIHKYEYNNQTTYLRNPLVELQNENNRKTKNLFGSVSAEASIIQGMNLRAMFSYNYDDEKGRDYKPSTTYEGSAGYTGQKGSLIETTTTSQKKELEATLSYAKTIERHVFDAVAGLTYTRRSRESSSIGFNDFPDDNIQTGLWQGANFSYKNGSSSAAVMFSYFLRLNYNYGGKYYFTGSVRRDASSSFARNNRYGTFPALAVAWNIAGEDFLKNKSWLTLLKIRASWGLTGMASVGEYGWRAMFRSSEYLDKPAFVPKQIGNDDLKWESTEQYNLALDFGLLKRSRITGTLGVYLKKSTDVLYPFTPAPSMGITSNATVNLAAIKNKGIEFNMNARVLDGKSVRLELGFNISKNVSKITNLDQEFRSSLTTSTLSNTVIQEGKTLGLFYGYKTDGVFQTQEEVDRYEALNADYPYQGVTKYDKTSPGDIKFVDLSDDGRVNFDYQSTEDKTVLGSSVPDFSGGVSARVSWKGFALSMQGTFSYGNMKSWDGEGKQFNMSWSAPSNLLDIALKRWTPENPTSKYPKMKIENKLSSYFSDFYLHDASYFKIQNLNLNYSVPSKLVEKTRFIKSLDISFSVNNVYTFTSYPGPNPESFSSNRISGAAVDNSVYPMTRTFNIGARVSF